MTRRSLAWMAALFAVLVAADQWVKHLVETRLPLQEVVDVLPFIALYRTYNTGVAFSMFSWMGDTGLILLSLSVIAFVLFLTYRTSHWQVISRIGFTLIIGGAVGNLIDRAVVLSDGRVVHDGSLGDLGQHHRRLGGHEHLDHGRTADDHDEGAESWLGGAVEP